MQEKKAKNLHSFWILLTGMILILGYFLPIFADREIHATVNPDGGLGIRETYETYTGYQGIAIAEYRGFFVWFVGIVLLCAIAMMVLSSIQLTKERSFPVALPILVGVMTGTSFFLLILYSWIGWILEVFILLNLIQLLHLDGALQNSYREKIIRAVILIVLIVLLPTSMLLSWHFYPSLG